jgi:hypothetical protein
MAEIAVRPQAEGEYEVEVRDGGRTTVHRVGIPAGFLDALGVPADDPARAVRESVVFLLEREPATSILRRFSLPDISRYFPEYEAEIVRRLR